MNIESFENVSCFDEENPFFLPPNWTFWRLSAPLKGPLKTGEICWEEEERSPKWPVRKGRGPGEDGHQQRVTGAKWSPPSWAETRADTSSECWWTQDGRNYSRDLKTNPILSGVRKIQIYDFPDMGEMVWSKRISDKIERKSRKILFLKM